MGRNAYLMNRRSRLSVLAYIAKLGPEICKGPYLVTTGDRKNGLVAALFGGAYACLSTLNRALLGLREADESSTLFLGFSG